MKKNIPIILAAFGTSTPARDTYTFIEKKVSKRYPDAKVYWAFTSRTLRNKMASTDYPMCSLEAVIRHLKQKGYDSAVVQSLHIVPGFEYEKLEQVKASTALNLSIGCPLLQSEEDCMKVIDALEKYIPDPRKTITVLAGHGTAHETASAIYLQFYKQLKLRYPENVFFSMVEGMPGWDSTLEAIQESGIRLIKIVPFMFVAGDHIINDVLGDKPGSWKNMLQGYSIDSTEHGLGFNNDIVEIYLDHVHEALIRIA